MKRQRSPSSSGGRPKVPRTISHSATGEVPTKDSASSKGRIRIEVQLRSSSKAARNDPKPPINVEEFMRFITSRKTEASLGSSAGAAEGPHNLVEAGVSSIATSSGHVDQEDPVQRRTIRDGDRGRITKRPLMGENDEDESNDSDDKDENEADSVENDEDDDGDDGDEDDSDEDDGDEDDDDGSESTSSSFDDEFPWLEEMDGRAMWVPLERESPASNLEHQRIARCDAKLIRRDRMRESFWLEMEEPSQETSDLAFELFDRYGRLNREYYEHEFKKGTGVWGKELDHGDLLLFETLQVNKEYRRRGFGTEIVNAILEKTRKKVDESVGFFALVRPGFLFSELENDLEPEQAAESKKRMLQASQSFWQSLGFRRVGTSSWFARTDSPDHPSQRLEVSRDYKDPEEPSDASFPDHLKQLFGKLADPGVEETECIKELRRTFPKESEEQQWLVVDQDRNTLLHIAATSSKPDLVKFITSKASHTKTMRNKEGYTPLEALRSRLEHQRTRDSTGYGTRVRSDAFKGFAAQSIACLAALDNGSTFDLSTLSPRDIEAVSSATEEQVRMARQLNMTEIRKTLRLKYGCTCGECIGGFLSPRMRSALLAAAEINHDYLNEDMDSDGPFWVENNNHLLTHLPSSVQENLKTNKSMRQGFTNLCNHFAECLRRGMIPTEDAVLEVLRRYQSEWPPVTKAFLQRGGTVASVANMIFESAIGHDRWAGEDPWTTDDDSSASADGETDQPVACRNDHEFGFVGGMCGYKRVRPVSSRFVDLSGRELDLD